MRLSRRGVLPAIAGSVLTGNAVAQPTAGNGEPAMPLKLVVLDIGGTLIADHGEVPGSMLGAFAQHGIIVTPQEFSEWRGASKRGMVRHFVAREHKSDALIEPIYADFTQTVTKAYEKVQPIAGAEQALKELAAMKLILATSTGFDGPLTQESGTKGMDRADKGAIKFMDGLSNGVTIRACLFLGGFLQLEAKT